MTQESRIESGACRPLVWASTIFIFLMLALLTARTIAHPEIDGFAALDSASATREVAE